MTRRADYLAARIAGLETTGPADAANAQLFQRRKYLAAHVDAARARLAVRTDLVVAIFSFILLNLATMALWQIEGLILFALICGYAMFSAVQAGAVRWEGRRRLGSRGDAEGRTQIGEPSRAG